MQYDINHVSHVNEMMQITYLRLTNHDDSLGGIRILEGISCALRQLLPTPMEEISQHRAAQAAGENVRYG